VPALDLNSAAVGIFVRVYGNMRHVSNLRRKLIWGVLLPLAVLAAAVISLPYWLNSLDYKALLILQAEEQLGRKVEIRQANVEVLPKVRVSLEGVSVKERDGQATFLTADRLFAEIRIFPLLTRKIAVNVSRWTVPGSSCDAARTVNGIPATSSGPANPASACRCWARP